MRFSVKAGLAAAQIAATTCAIFFGAEAASAQPADAPVPVVETTVGQGDVNIVLDGLGTVRALNEATIRSQVTGVLQSVDFAEGATVHRGDVLAQIDPRPYQAALEQAEAQKQRDEASLADTQTNLDRNTPLLSRGFATDQLVTNEKYQIAELQASVKADQATIDNAQTQLSYTTLTAPFDGVVGLRLLDVGNVIHPNDTTGLVVVSQIQPVSVVFTLPRNRAAAGAGRAAIGEGDGDRARPVGHKRLGYGRTARHQQRGQSADRDDPVQGGVSERATPALAGHVRRHRGGGVRAP